MGRREQAREEAAFMRGDVGVDGQSTKGNGSDGAEERDEAQVEQDKAREQLLRGGTWLGREFLTWLLWRSEAGESVAELPKQQGGDGIVPLFLGRVMLRGVHGEIVELSAKGTLAPYSVHLKRAIDDGLLVHAARIRFTSGERSWEASLDAEHLDVKSAKLPELLTEAEDDRTSERLDLAEQLSAMIDAVVATFMATRLSKAWGRDVVPQMKDWMRGDGAQNALTKAKRAS